MKTYFVTIYLPWLFFRLHIYFQEYRLIQGGLHTTVLIIYGVTSSARCIITIAFNYFEAMHVDGNGDSFQTFQNQDTILKQNPKKGVFFFNGNHGITGEDFSLK